MKRLLCVLALSAWPLGAQETPPAAPTAEAGGDVRKDSVPRWSVVGEWQVTHPAWTDVIVLEEGGGLRRVRGGDTGRWVLTSDGGMPMLVFRWDLFGTESLTMVGPNQFRGNARNGRFIDMRRGEIAVEANAAK